MRLPVARLGVAAVVVLMGGGVVWGFLQNREDAERDSEAESPVAAAGHVLQRDDQTFVVLDSATRRQIGVSLAEVSAVQRPARLSAFGRVMSLNDLTDARDRFATAEASAERARARLAQTRAEYRRLTLLYADSGMVSASRLERARSSYQADSAGEAAASQALHSSSATLREDFGPVISEWLRRDSPELTRLLAGQRVLLQVTLPPPLTLSAPPERATILVASGDTVPARFVSWASRTDPEIQGQSFFCIANRVPGLLPGARVEVRVQPAGAPAGEAMVSEDAVVWYQSAPWVYVRADGDALVRQRVRIEGTEPGVYEVAGVASGAWVVVDGASLVLSTELQSSIPADEDG